MTAKNEVTKTSMLDDSIEPTPGPAGFRGDDRRCAEGAPKLADLGLQGVGCVGHLAVTPESLDQPVGADGLPPMKLQ